MKKAICVRNPIIRNILEFKKAVISVMFPYIIMTAIMIGAPLIVTFTVVGILRFFVILSYLRTEFIITFFLLLLYELIKFIILYVLYEN